MEIKRCSKGHLYDAEANSSCPVCAAEAGNSGADSTQAFTRPNMEDEFGPTQPFNVTTGSNAVSGNQTIGSAEDVGKTVPVGGFTNTGNTYPTGAFINSVPPTIPNPLNGGTVPPTGPVSGVNFETNTPDRRAVDPYDQPTVTIGLNNHTAGPETFEPVVGWLVCVKGPSRGADFRIHAGYNYIGKSEHNDISVRGDNTISRNRHAVIAYDPKTKTFLFGPAEGKNFVYLNEKPLMSVGVVNARDKICIGNTTLMFVPLCDDTFDWSEE